MEQPMSTDHTTSSATRHYPIDTWPDFFATHLATVPLVVILRGLPPEEALATARTAWAAGVRLVEVTVEGEHGLAGVAALAQAAPAGVPVGAGTVTTPQRLFQAVEAGADFGVAPGLDPDTIQAADQRGVPFLPGVATPTEAGHALRLGVSTIKAFPASVLGPEWVKALSGPFPELRVVTTGGVTASTAPDFLAAGAHGVGVGQAAASAEALPPLVEAVRVR